MGRESAPRVDPQQLALAQAQFGLMREQADFARDAYENQYLPMMLRQEQLGLRQYEDQRARAAQADAWALEDRQNAEAALSDYETAAQGMYGEDGRKDARGLAVADIRQAASAAQGQLARGMASRGVNVADPKYAFLSDQNALQGNLAAAQAANLTDAAFRAEGLNSKGRIASMRTGNAGGFLGMASGISGQGLAASGTGFNAFLQGGGARNAGMGLAGQFGNNANAGYDSYFNNQMKGYQADQAGSWQSALGGIAGTALGAYAGGWGYAAGKRAGG